MFIIYSVDNVYYHNNTIIFAHKYPKKDLKSKSLLLIIYTINLDKICLNNVHLFLDLIFYEYQTIAIIYYILIYYLPNLHIWYVFLKYLCKHKLYLQRNKLLNRKIEIHN